MDPLFAEQSKQILIYIALSLVLVIIFMTTNSTFAKISRVGILILLGYVASLVWSQIQKVKSELFSITSSSTTLTTEQSTQIEALNSNLFISYIFLFVTMVNFIFIATSLLSLSQDQSQAQNEKMVTSTQSLLSNPLG